MLLQNPPRRPKLDHARDDDAYAIAYQEIAEANRRIIAAALSAARGTAKPKGGVKASARTKRARVELRGLQAIVFALALLGAMATSACLDPLPSAYEPTPCDRAMVDGEAHGCFSNGVAVSK